METSFLVDQVLGIVATASVSALVATGLALSFRLMGVINLAHGEFMMLGAYGVVVGLGLRLPFALAVLVALVVGLALGAFVEVTLVRRFYGRPELAILGTFGLGLVLRQLVELGFGKQYQPMNNPLPGSITILGRGVPALSPRARGDRPRRAGHHHGDPHADAGGLPDPCGGERSGGRGEPRDQIVAHQARRVRAEHGDRGASRARSSPRRRTSSPAWGWTSCSSPSSS